MNWEFYNSDKRLISDFWKLPDNFECCTMNLELENFQKLNIERKLYAYNLEMPLEKSKNPNNYPDLFDSNQKSLIKDFHVILNQLPLEESEHTKDTLGRLVDYKQAFKVQ